MPPLSASNSAARGLQEARLAGAIFSSRGRHYNDSRGCQGRIEQLNAPQRFIPDPRVEAAIEYGLSLRLSGSWETNGQGQIIMNPPIGLAQAKRAGRIIAALKASLPDWQVWPEVGIHTADGVKAPDLGLAAPGFAEATDSRSFLIRAPEICVEIMSPSNTWEEMRHKSLLYLAAGAREVWVCDDAGCMHFFDGSGEQGASALAAGVGNRAD